MNVLFPQPFINNKRSLENWQRNFNFRNTAHN